MGLHELILSGSTFCLPSHGTFDLVLFFPHFIEKNTMLQMSHAVTPVLPSACAELLGGSGGGVLSSSYFPGFPLSSWNSGLIHSTSFPSLLCKNVNHFHYTLLFVLHKYYQTVSGDQKALTSLPPPSWPPKSRGHGSSSPLKLSLPRLCLLPKWQHR